MPMTQGVIGIFLAAGRSRRMGCPKLALNFRGRSLGSIALQAALRSDLQEVLVVVRSDDSLAWIPSDLHGDRWRPLVCPDAERGQAHSLRCGVQEAMRRGAGAVVVLLADQPFVTVEIINQLMRSHAENTRTSYIAAANQGVPMPPVLFDSSLYPSLLTLQGDEGARKILTGGLHIECDPSLFLDIDTPEEFQRSKDHA